MCDWGLGFAIDAYGMGRHASPRAFGHGGALSAISFADPEHGLVAVLQTNGMCGNDDHYLRLDAVTTALYEDLGLVPTRRAGPRQAVPHRRSVRARPRRSDEHHGRRLDDHQGRRREARRRRALRGAGVHRRAASTRRSSGATRWCASSRTRRPVGTRTRRCAAATSRSGRLSPSTHDRRHRSRTCASSTCRACSPARTAPAMLADLGADVLRVEPRGWRPAAHGARRTGRVPPRQAGDDARPQARAAPARSCVA